MCVGWCGVVFCVGMSVWMRGFVCVWWGGSVGVWVGVCVCVCVCAILCAFVCVVVCMLMVVAG